MVSLLFNTPKSPIVEVFPQTAPQPALEALVVRMCGLIAQLVEQRTSNAEVTGSNPVEALIFFRLLLSTCLNWKIYCDGHSSLSVSTTLRSNELKF